MTTPKKPTATASNRGANDPYMQILNDFKLADGDMQWMDLAKCGPDDGIKWFPEQGEAHLTIVAKKFCSDCPVRERCLKFALTNEIMQGVWGGKSPKERERLLRSQQYKDKI